MNEEIKTANHWLKFYLNLYRSAKQALGDANRWSRITEDPEYWNKSRGYWLMQCRELKQKLRESAAELDRLLHEQRTAQ